LLSPQLIFPSFSPYFLLSRSAREELADIVPEEKDDEKAQYCDSVVVGLAPSIFTYDNLNAAFRVLVGEARTSGAVGQQGNHDSLSGQPLKLPLIATHKARYIQSDTNDRLSLGPGPFVAALEYAAGVQAHVVGKPTKSFFEMVIQDFGNAISSRDGIVAVIGDDVESDLGEGALELGLWRVLGPCVSRQAGSHMLITILINLVRTGKYRQGDETRKGVEPPDEICDSFSSFVDSLLLENWRREGGQATPLPP